MKISIKRNYGNLTAGSIVSWEVFAASHSPQIITVESARHLTYIGTIVFLYPICFIGIEEEQLVIYTSKNWNVSGPLYKCPNSDKAVSYSSLSSSSYIPMYTEEEIADFFKVQPTPMVRLCGETVEEGEVIYYIRLDDMAWGQVKYFDGMMSKYPNSEYLFFLSSGERDTLLHSMVEGTSLEKI